MNRSGSVVCHTHHHILLEVFLAANKMGDFRRDLVGKCSSIDLYTMPHLFEGASFSEITGDRNGELLDRLFSQSRWAGLITKFSLHG